MTLAAYTATTGWYFPLGDDARQIVKAGSIILLDDGAQATAALADGTISSVAPTLSGAQQTALTAGAASSSSALGSRGAVVASMGLT